MCRLPTHPQADDAKSFSINVSKQVWICHSTACAKGRRGKKGGDVIELVAVMESCSLRDAGLKLAEWFGISMSGETNGGSAPKNSAAVERQPSESRYGIYDPLAEWIEVRAANESFSEFEKSAYRAVLGRMEEMARSERGGAT